MKKLLTGLALIIVIGAISFLYRLQLGAIPFLLLSIFFFILAFYQLLGRKKNEETKEQNERV